MTLIAGEPCTSGAGTPLRIAGSPRSADPAAARSVPIGMATTPPNRMEERDPNGVWPAVLVLAGAIVLIVLLAIPFAGDADGASTIGLGAALAIFTAPGAELAAQPAGLRPDGTERSTGACRHRFSGDGGVRCNAMAGQAAPRLVLVRTGAAISARAPGALPVAADGAGSNDVVGDRVAVSDAGLRPDTWILTGVRSGRSAATWVCAGGRQHGPRRIALRTAERAVCVHSAEVRSPIRGASVRRSTGSFDAAIAFIPPSASLGRYRLDLRDATGRLVVRVDDAAHGDGFGPRVVPAGSYELSLVRTGGGTGGGDLATTLTCVDDLGLLIDGSPLRRTTVRVGSNRRVTCVFQVEDPTATGTETSVPPVFLPPTLIRGRAVLRAPSGCVADRTVRSVVIGRNVARAAFARNGRVVRVVRPDPIGPMRAELVTRLSRNDTGMHTVVVRVRFARGATPQRAVLVHRFALCRSSTVAG